MLRHCIPASIRQTLKLLPKSLDDTYLRVLSEIPQANQAHAHRMLQCLVVAVRPLEVAEFAELLAFEFDGALGGTPKYRPALRLDNQTQAVLSTCSSLVTIITKRRPDRQVVQFSHFSVKEFLVSNRLAPSLGDISQYNISLGPAHTTLTQTCLGLLLYSDNQITEGIVEDSPLAGYAAEHWVEHAQFEDVASRVNDGMETLFDLDKPHFKAWVRIYDRDSGVRMRNNFNHPSPLYYSALCGFDDLVAHLAIKHPQHVNAFGGKYGFPLLAALSRGHTEVAELLLKHSADIDVRESMGKTILLMALSSFKMENDVLKIAKFLLTHGADVNARDVTFTSSLHLAEESGMQQVVAILLKHQADVNSQDNHGQTPLHRLLRGGMYDDRNSDHVRLLLEHGAEVNRRDEENQTPFLLAIQLGWFRAAQILLKHGADLIVEKNHDKSLWHLLSDSWIYDEDEVLEHALLLSKLGVEINRCNGNDETPLHLAMGRNRFRLAEFLLEHGADVNAENNRGMTPLCMLPTTWIYDEGAVLDYALLLLKHGAEVNKRDKDNQSPLHLATIRIRRSKLIRFLLEHGADPNAQNIQGMTPLHMLPQSQMYDDGTVLDYARLLLQHGAGVNKLDKTNQTPLHLATQMNQLRLAELLIEHGADANAENNEDKTPFQMLLEIRIYDEGDVLNHAMLLLKHGAEVNRRDKDNQTPLLLATERGWFELARILLEQGADVNAANKRGKTPLHILPELEIYNKNDFGDVLDRRRSLEYGTEINRQCKDDKSPLLLHRGMGMYNFVCNLLILAQILPWRTEHRCAKYHKPNLNMAPRDLFPVFLN